MVIKTTQPDKSGLLSLTTTRTISNWWWPLVIVLLILQAYARFPQKVADRFAVQCVQPRRYMALFMVTMFVQIYATLGVIALVSYLI